MKRKYSIKGMDFSILTPYESPFPLWRVGSPHDGGYMIVQIPGVQYRQLLSAGIASNITFEDMFINMFEPEEAFGFDGTIETCPPCPGLQWEQRNIGPYETGTETNLEKYIHDDWQTFLKMDIEGSEVDWILNAKDVVLDRFDQIVIEFHPNFYTTKGVDALKRLLTTHVILHLHGNNAMEPKIIESTSFPSVFELTLVHKRHLSGQVLKKNTRPLPLDIDQQNLPFFPPLLLTQPPFVN